MHSPKIKPTRWFNLLLAFFLLAATQASAAPQSLHEARKLTQQWVEKHPSQIIHVNVNGRGVDQDIRMYRTRDRGSKTHDWIMKVECRAPKKLTFISFYDKASKAFLFYNVETGIYSDIGNPESLSSQGMLFMPGAASTLYTGAGRVTETVTGYQVQIVLPTNLLQQLTLDPKIAAINIPTDLETCSYVMNFDPEGQMLTSSSLVGNTLLTSTVAYQDAKAEDIKRQIKEVRKDVKDLDVKKKKDRYDFAREISSTINSTI